MRAADVVIGIPGDADLSERGAVLANVLDAQFEARESGHYGGTYYLAEPGGDEELRLYRNHDPIDGTPFFAEAQDCPVLLRLLFTERDPDALVDRIRTEIHPATRVLRRRG
jgi:hypothetical protein